MDDLERGPNRELAEAAVLLAAAGGTYAAFGDHWLGWIAIAVLVATGATMGVDALHAKRAIRKYRRRLGEDEER